MQSVFLLYLSVLVYGAPDDFGHFLHEGIVGVSKGLHNLTAMHQGVLVKKLICSLPDLKCLSVCNNTKL